MRKLLRFLRRMGLGLLVIAMIIMAGLVTSPWKKMSDIIMASPVAESSDAAPEGMSVHFLNVGDADCTLFVVDGKTMMIDGGDIGKGNIPLEYLQSLGIKKLDIVVGTHPHADHMGGLSEVIEHVPFEKVYSCMEQSMLGVFRHFQRIVERKGGKIEAPKPGTQVPLGGATVTFLSPSRSYFAMNNMSLVTRVDYGDISIVVEGDAQREAEADIVANGLAKKATVLRVGHHGSNDATSPEYLDKLQPKYAVIPCGENNNGHPHRRLLALLESRNIEIFRTDLDGNIVARTDGKSISFTKHN